MLDTLLTHLPDANSVFVKRNGEATRRELLPIDPVQIPE